ncbi:MAG: HAMP domain-containing sensor histidine kinase [Cyanobacteria bacterium J06632_22]
MDSRLQASSTRQEIVVEKCFDQVVCFTGQPTQLNQVFMSILDNAIDALDEGPVTTDTPKISIEMRAESAGLCIRITNNGPAISPEVQSKLFDPFFTTKPVGKGTGMGLAICDRIIAQHHGQLDCVSDSTRGTTFSIRLPRDTGAALA